MCLTEGNISLTKKIFLLCTKNTIFLICSVLASYQPAAGSFFSRGPAVPTGLIPAAYRYTVLKKKMVFTIYLLKLVENF